MPKLIEYLEGDRVVIGLVTAQDRGKLSLTDAAGRASKLAADKVVLEHVAASIEAFVARRDGLAREIDVPLLWESLADAGEAGPQDLSALAGLYFGEDSSLHRSAVLQALLAERIHFRRKALRFEPRSAAELTQLSDQDAAGRRKAEALEALGAALAAPAPDDELAARMERWLRGGGEDPLLEQALSARHDDPALGAFERLLAAGRLPPTTDLEVVRANLRAELPEPVLRYAAALEPPAPRPDPGRACFTIDDPETREVDDAVSAAEEGDRIRVDVDIADPASVIAPGDPVDREALRRATTAYLPTGTCYLLPERIGCDLCSLTPGAPRPALRLTAWFSAAGALQEHALSVTTVTVGRRLDYETADALLRAPDGGPDAAALALLGRVSDACAAERRAAGALFFGRREWKLRVRPDGEIDVTRLPSDSPSRGLVAEMMILFNRLAAQEAVRRGIPIIFRVQGKPSGEVPAVDPADPTALERVRGLLQPATLSLTPGGHYGLGLPAYTQASSPLRRYADLVVQRQLQSSLSGHPAPYGPEELLRVLAAAEGAERELRRVESAVTERWALEVVARLPDRRGLTGLVLAETPAGLKVELDVSGARGILPEKRGARPGQEVRVNVTRVEPRRGFLRLALAD